MEEPRRLGLGAEEALQKLRPAGVAGEVRQVPQRLHQEVAVAGLMLQGDQEVEEVVEVLQARQSSPQVQGAGVELKVQDGPAAAAVVGALQARQHSVQVEGR